MSLPEYDDLKYLKSHEYGNVYSSDSTIIKVFYYTDDEYDNKEIEKICSITIELSKLIPEYVPTIYLKHETQQYVALIMEKIEAVTLYKYIVDKRSHNIRNVSRIVQLLLKSVTALHKAGYVHFDLHGNNILITNDHNVKLIDFSESDTINAVQEGDGVTPKIHQDYLQLKCHIAQLIFPNLPLVSIVDTLNIIRNYSEKDVIEYDNNPISAVKLYNVLNIFASIECYD